MLYKSCRNPGDLGRLKHVLNIAADNKDGVAAAAAATNIDGRFRRIHRSRSCVEADQCRSCSAGRYSRVCTYWNTPAWTVLEHQVLKLLLKLSYLDEHLLFSDSMPPSPPFDNI